MKKLILGTCLSLSLFCGAKEAVAQTTTEILPEKNAVIKVWANDPGEKELFELGAKKFTEKYKDLNLKVVHEPVGILDSFRLLVQDGGTIEVGDVVSMTHDVLGKAIVSGVIMENLVSTEDLKNNFLTSAITASTDVNGVIYGFPYSFETLLMYYNKDLISKPNTFEGIIEFAKTFNNPEEYQFALAWGIADYYQSRAFIGMYGGYEFGNNGTNSQDIGIANEEFKKGMEKLLTLKKATVENTADVANSQIAEGLFLEELVATTISGPWARKRFLEDSGLNVGVTALPTFDGKNLTPFSTVKMLTVSSFTKYPKAAQLFAQFMSSEEMLLERFRLTGQAPVHKNLLNHPEVQADQFVAELIKQEKSATPMPSIAEMGYIWEPMNAAISEIWNNNRDIDEVLKQSKKVIEEQINIQ